MTILHYFEGEGTGGVTTAIEHLVQHTAKHHLVTVVCSDSPNLRAWRERLSATGARVVPCALRNSQDLSGWFDIPHMWRLVRLLQRTEVAHFHLHTVFACQAAIIWAALVRVPVRVLTEHFIFHLDYLRRRPLRFPLSLVREARIHLHLLLNRLVFRVSSGLITLSQMNRTFLESHFTLPADLQVEVIPNGVDTDKFAKAIVDPGNVRAELGVQSQRTLLITTVADLNNAKGHEFLLRAVPAVAASVSDALFLLVGDGHLRNDLQTLASSIGIERQIHFLGYRSDIPRILAVSDLFVLPSLFEAMPLSVLEAMATGLAVVSTTGGALPDVVVEGETGYLVPPKDADALADRITSLLTHPEVRSAFGMRGRERVKKYFEASRIAKRHEEFYSRLVTRRNERSQ